jgi:hypothetical protein
LELRRLLGRLTGERRILVPSGSTATVHLPLPPGRSAVLESFPDAGAYLFDVLRVAITMYTLVAGGFATPAAGKYSAGWWAAKLEDALSQGTCGYSVLGSDGRNVANLGLTPALAGRLAKEAFDCVGEIAKDSVGAAVAVIVGIVAGLLNGVVVGGQFIVDSLQGKTYRTILVGVKASPNPSQGTPATTPPIVSSSPPLTRSGPPASQPSPPSSLAPAPTHRPVVHYNCPNDNSNIGKYVPPGRYWENDFVAQGQWVTGGSVGIGANTDGRDHRARIGIYRGSGRGGALGEVIVPVTGYDGEAFSFPSPIRVMPGDRLYLAVSGVGDFTAYDNRSGCFIGRVDGYAS